MNKTVSVHNLAAPTVAELVDRARELAPLLRKNAAASEANRRQPHGRPLRELSRRDQWSSIASCATSGLRWASPL